jgi:hypothetical protein
MILIVRKIDNLLSAKNIFLLMDSKYLECVTNCEKLSKIKKKVVVGNEQNTMWYWIASK